MPDQAEQQGRPEAVEAEEAAQRVEGPPVDSLEESSLEESQPQEHDALARLAMGLALQHPQIPQTPP